MRSARGISKAGMAGMAVVVAAVLVPVLVPAAGGRVTELTKVDLEGGLGKVARVFGGKAMKADGLEREIAVRDQRKAVQEGDQREVTDLTAEAVWKITRDGRRCEKTTFEEIRQRWEDMRREGGPLDQSRPPQEAGARREDVPTYVVDVETEAGGEVTVAGHRGKEKVIRMTVHQEGMSLEEGGGSVVVMTLVEAQEAVPGLKALQDFDLKYATMMVDAMGFDMPSFKEIMLSHPSVGKAMEKFREADLGSGGPILQTRTEVSSMPGPGAGRQSAEAEADADDDVPTSGRGLAGRLAGKFMKKRRQQEEPEESAGGLRRIYASEQSFTFIGADPGDTLLELPSSCPA